MHESIVSELSEKFIKQGWTKKELLLTLFSNEEIKNIYQNEIRRSTIIGYIANSVLSKAEVSDNCQILAIGDIAYFGHLAEKWNQLMQSSLNSINVSRLAGYDLGGVGSDQLKKSIVSYMSHYYDTCLPADIFDSIIPSYGGTDSFVSIINTLKLRSGNQKINFIYPEASFLANVKIAEILLGKESLIKFSKPSFENFFISQEQIEEFYRSSIRLDEVNIYYITPVGNPTGNSIHPNELYDISVNIIKRDPSAILIFDTVYVGLLINTESRNLFTKIFENSTLLNRIIFTESISKTLGTTGIRIGWSWTMNQSLLNDLKKFTSLTKAGFSKILDEFTIQLLDCPGIIDFQNEVYESWSNERMKFMDFMQAQHSELFDFKSSPNISCREGIYILLKIQTGFSFEEVYAITGIIGVGIELSDGKYIRYAFGNIQPSNN